MIAPSEKKSSSREIAELLKQEILTGQFRAGCRFYSARSLAERFSIAYGTADKVLNLLRDEHLIQRNSRSGNIVAATRDGRGLLRIGFMENDFANIGKIVDNVSYFAWQLSRKFREEHCDFRLIPQSELPDFAELRKYDGLVLGSQAIFPWGCPEVLGLDIPIVVCRSDVELDQNVNQILPDLGQALRDLAGMIDFARYAGFTIVYEEHGNALCRRDAFRAMLAANGIDPAGVPEYRSDFHNPVRNYPLWKKLAAESRGRLLLCTGDIAAMEIYQVFCAEKIIPGRDVDLVSIDNLEQYGFNRGCDKVITSIDFPRQLVAEAAVRLLLSLCRYPELRACRHTVRIPGNTVIRKTALLSRYQVHERNPV